MKIKDSISNGLEIISNKSEDFIEISKLKYKIHSEENSMEELYKDMGKEMYTTITVTGTVIIQLFPKQLIGIFNNDPQLLAIGIHGIRIYLFMLPVIGFQIVSSNYFQAIGKAKISMFLSLSRQVIILIPLLLILPRFFDLNGVWISGPSADALASILTAIFLFVEIRHLNKLHGEDKDVVI